MRHLHIFSVLTLCALLLTGNASAEEAPHRNPAPFKWIRPVQGQILKTYSEGMAPYCVAGKWGYMDKNGNIAILSQYEEAGAFENGLAIVKLDGKWGVIDIHGKTVFECIYDNISPFSDGYALAETGSENYYLSSDGKRQHLPDNLTFYPYSSGLAKVKKSINGKDKYGYIDTKGLFIMEPEFDAASDFYGNTAFVLFKGKSFSIEKNGRKHRLDFPLNPANRTQFLPDGSGFIEQGGKFIFVKYQGDEYSLLPVRYDMISRFSEGRVLVKSEQGPLMYLNTLGIPVLTLPDDCSAAGDFSEGKAWICCNGKYGFIDKSGKIVIDTIFSYTSDFNDGMAYVVYSGRNGLIRMADKDDTYPDLQIDQLTLSDMNDNATVESGEDFKITVNLANHGNEDAVNINVSLTGKSEQASGFFYSGNTQHIDTLRAGNDVTVSFDGTAPMDISSDDIQITIKAIADNQMQAVTEPMTFSAVGINECKPILASYWIHSVDHSPLNPGNKAILEFSVMNEGTDIAKNVKVDMIWPAGITPLDSLSNVGDIAPGATKIFRRTFALDSTVSPAAQLSIVATLSEFTGKHQDIKYFLFETGKMNMEVSLLQVQPSATQSSFYTQMQDIMMETPDGGTIERSELLTGLTQTASPDINKYALIIGNEDYNSFKQQTLYEPNVDFAVNDADAFKEYAIKIVGVPEENIIMLKNATYSQMKFNINKLARIAGIYPGNVELYVYYAGHGQVDGKSKESYLIPVDVSTTSPSEGIKLEDMYATISGSGCKRAMMFLDACYSGMGRGIVIQPKNTPVSGNMVVMTASSATQRSMPYEEKRHGMFTYFLLKKLKDTKGDITIEELFKDVKANVQSNSVWINDSEQTPELISGPGIDENWKSWKL